MEHEQAIEAESRVITLQIQSPVGKWANPFHPGNTVAEVIHVALEHFKDRLAPGDYILCIPGSETPLEPSKTLEALGLKNKDKVNLLPAQPGGGR